MNESEKVIEQQSESANETMRKFEEIAKSIDKVNNVAKELDASTKDMLVGKDRVSSLIDNLSSISEENAASTQETSASTQVLMSTVNDIKDEVFVLKTISDQLVDAVGVFSLSNH